MIAGSSSLLMELDNLCINFIWDYIRGAYCRTDVLMLVWPADVKLEKIKFFSYMNFLNINLKLELVKSPIYRIVDSPKAAPQVDEDVSDVGVRHGL